ncbi:multidrug effflux MFS transporter [Ferruginibacter sp.]
MDVVLPSPSPGKNYVQRSRWQNILLITIIGLLNTLTPFSIDMYLPAFPKIAQELHTGIGNVALSVSTYFLGFALGQILYGPLLDRFGRKRPLYIGLFFYMIATIGCTLCNTIEIFWVARFLQALSGCVASVAAMAMVLDFFPPEKSARIISLLILILGISPLLAPTVGSLIIASWHWHLVFVTLAIFALLMFLVSFFLLPEGQEPDLSVSLMPRPIINSFRQILTDRQFYVHALAGTFSFAGLFVYVAGSPAIFMDEFQMSPKIYGAIFAGLSIGFIGSSQLNHFLTQRFTGKQILQTVLIIQSLTGIIFFITVFSGWYTMSSTIFFIFIVLACSGLTYPNAAALAMTPFTKNAGTAAALLGFIQIGIGGLISAGVGMLHFKGSFSVALIMAVSASIALLIFLKGKK